jgi:hypothetical protein
VIAGNALAHSTTVPAAARFASLLMNPVSSRRHLTSSYRIASN